MNGLWLLLRLIKLLLHYESITKRKLIWWRFIIINTSFFLLLLLPFFVIQVYTFQDSKCSLSVSIFYGQPARPNNNISRKEKKGKKKWNETRLLHSMASITFLVWVPHSVSPLAHFSPLLKTGRQRHCAGCRDRYARWTRRTLLKAITVTYWIFSPPS